jgi:MFS family permease
MAFWFILLPLIGVMIGSLGVGHAMKTRRREAKMILDILGIVGCVLAIIDVYEVMMIGKFLFGVAVGGLITLAPKIIEETIPVQNFDYGYGAMTMIGVDIFIVLCQI